MLKRNKFKVKASNGISYDNEGYTLNYDDRNLYLTSEVNVNTVQYLLETIHYINELDEMEDKRAQISNQSYIAPPINIYINSIGGDIMAALSLITAIESSETPIYTHCIGEASSAGLLIFITGHKRFAYKHSIFMYHQLSSGSLGTFKDLEDGVEVLRHLQERLEEIFLVYTKFTSEELKDIRSYKKDHTFYYQEAMEKGIVDEVIISDVYKKDVEDLKLKFAQKGFLESEDEELEDIMKDLSDDEIIEALKSFKENKNIISTEVVKNKSIIIDK